MSEIDWSKAPDGTTHYYAGLFYKIDELGDARVYRDNRWQASSFDAEDIQGMDAKPTTWNGEGMPPVGVTCESMMLFV